MLAVAVPVVRDGRNELIAFWIKQLLFHLPTQANVLGTR